jgi:hypothetical protein
MARRSRPCTFVPTRITVAALEWIYRLTSFWINSEGYMACSLQGSTLAVCTSSVGGEEANDPGISTTTLYATDMFDAFIPVTLTNSLPPVPTGDDWDYTDNYSSTDDYWETASKLTSKSRATAKATGSSLATQTSSGSASAKPTASGSGLAATTAPSSGSASTSSKPTTIVSGAGAAPAITAAAQLMMGGAAVAFALL